MMPGVGFLETVLLVLVAVIVIGAVAYLFDLLHLDGTDTLDLPYTRRRQLLDRTDSLSRGDRLADLERPVQRQVDEAKNGSSGFSVADCCWVEL